MGSEPGRHRRRTRIAVERPAVSAADPWDPTIDDFPVPRASRSRGAWLLNRLGLRSRRRQWIVIGLLAALLVASLTPFVLTGNPRPLAVVDSDSMQHRSGNQPGGLNPGDIVLVQQTPWYGVVTSAAGIRSGFSTYGEPGDVLVYYPNGDRSGTPVIHRAIVYLEFNTSAWGSFDAPSLVGLSCGNASDAVYATPGTPNWCRTTDLTESILLFEPGPRTVDVPILSTCGEIESGFVTMGDNNSLTDQQLCISGLVQPLWILGVARGLIPWYGSLFLLTEGRANDVSNVSWSIVAATLACVVGLPLWYWRRRRHNSTKPVGGPQVGN